jgi:hypothetical protein
VSDSSLTKGETATVTFKISEAVRDFTASDVAVTNGTLSGFAQDNAQTYTAVFTPASGVEADAIIAVRAGAYTDVDGNTGSSAQTALKVDTRLIDTTRPGVTVSAGDTFLTKGEKALLTFKFSERILGFTASDVSATNGTLSGFTKLNDFEFTASFTPSKSTSGKATITVAEASYRDDAANSGLGAQFMLDVATGGRKANSPPSLDSWLL